MSHASGSLPALQASFFACIIFINMTEAYYEQLFANLQQDKLTHEIVSGISLGRVESSHNAGRQDEVETVINGLFAVIDGGNAHWTARFLGGHTYSTWRNTLRPHDINWARFKSMSLGEYVTSAAFDALPIEMSEEGPGYVDISLAVGEEHILRVQADGYYSTDYLEPEDDPQDFGFIVDYSIDYHATVARISADK
jgi:hypothetical protein